MSVCVCLCLYVVVDESFGAKPRHLIVHRLISGAPNSNARSTRRRLDVDKEATTVSCVQLSRETRSGVPVGFGDQHLCVAIHASVVESGSFR